YDNVRLVAKYEDGTEIIGEHNIDVPNHKPGLRITNLETHPIAKLDEEAKRAIIAADLIILGPGDFYTNTVANLIVKGMVQAIKKSKGKVLFIANLMDSPSEAPAYTLSNFTNDLKKYMPLTLIDYILVNNNLDFPKKALKDYEKENAHPIKDDLGMKDLYPGAKIIRADLLSETIPERSKGDNLSRSMIRHDSDKLCKAILNLVLA
ncbi:MAG TPA: 2-phospho-L-lactate transferase CofD family protein, partial [Patescibacteria group bacterium]|nr:2-phospho-L-lactate transferase CofD family protein [Patescibacteria group bacterium]